MATTTPARLDVKDMRELVLAHDPETAERMKSLRRKRERRKQRKAA